MANRERVHSIDIAKGIGIFSVVLVHFTVHGSWLSQLLLSFCVPFFFVMSGFLYHPRDTFSEQLKRCIEKIGIPLLCYALIDVVFTFLWRRFALAEALSLKDAAKILAKGAFLTGSANSNGPLWYLPVILEIELLFYPISRQKKAWPHAVFFLLLFAAGYVIHRVGPFRLGQVPGAFVFFAIGYYGKDLLRRLDSLSRKGLWFLGSTALFLLLCWLNGFSEMAARNYGRIYPLYFCVGALATVSILLLSAILHENRVLEFFGRNSLTVMCTHFYFAHFFIPALLNALGKSAWLDSPLAELVLALLLCVVLVPVILLINRCPAMCGRATIRLPEKHSSRLPAEGKPTSGRDSNIEILRIISILFIILNHYSAYGGFSYENPMEANALAVQFLHFGGKLGVDIFILISGFFLCTSSGFKLEKLVRLLAEVLFYSCVFVLCGAALGTLSVKQMIKMLLAVPYGEWEFITCYLMLFCLSPWLNLLIRAMNLKQHISLVLFLGVVWCVVPTLSNAGFAMSTLSWYGFLYLLAALLRRVEYLYENGSAAKWLGAGFGFIVLIWISEFCLDWIGLRIPAAAGQAEHFRAINGLLTTGSAICLLIGFRLLRCGSISWINRIASTTLGVFMLHDNGALRPVLWSQVFRTMAVQDSGLLVFHALGTALAILLVGAGIDLLRQRTVEAWFMGWIREPIVKLQSWMDKQISSLSAWAEHAQDRNENAE